MFRTAARERPSALAISTKIYSAPHFRKNVEGKFKISFQMFQKSNKSDVFLAFFQYIFHFNVASGTMPLNTSQMPDGAIPLDARTEGSADNVNKHNAIVEQKILTQHVIFSQVYYQKRNVHEFSIQFSIFSKYFLMNHNFRWIPCAKCARGQSSTRKTPRISTILALIKISNILFERFKVGLQI